VIIGDEEDILVMPKGIVMFVNEGKATVVAIELVCKLCDAVVDLKNCVS
jgi:hypothetical protein